MTKFRVQLAQFGLRVKEMGADGNCMFRSLSDQLEGHEKLHMKYRQEAVTFIGDGPVMPIGHELQVKNPVVEEKPQEERKANGPSQSNEKITV